MTPEKELEILNEAIDLIKHLQELFVKSGECTEGRVGATHAFNAYVMLQGAKAYLHKQRLVLQDVILRQRLATNA